MLHGTDRWLPELLKEALGTAKPRAVLPQKIRHMSESHVWRQMNCMEGNVQWKDGSFCKEAWRLLLE